MNPNLLSILLVNDSVVIGAGSFSMITSIISFKCMEVNFSVGALAYLKTNLVKSKTQNLVWNYFDIRKLVFWVSFLR